MGFSLSGILRVAAPIVGGILGGPAGAAIGGALGNSIGKKGNVLKNAGIGALTGAAGAGALGGAGKLATGLRAVTSIAGGAGGTPAAAPPGAVPGVPPGASGGGGGFNLSGILGGAGDFLKHNSNTLLAAGSALQGVNQQGQADDLRKKAMGMAEAEYAARAPLRTNALAALSQPMTPDLTDVFAPANTVNPFARRPAAGLRKVG